jgi:Recombinase
MRELGHAIAPLTADQIGRLLARALRRRVHEMVRVDGQSYQHVASWLNDNGVRRTNDKPWNSLSVHYIVRTQDARLGAAA